MNELHLTPDARWQDRGISVQWIEEKAEWIRRDTGAPGGIGHFFDSAGRLMRFCAYDYLLLGPMFFHAVIALEAMLRVHFDVDGDTRFKELLSKAVTEGVITDQAFSNPMPMPEYFQAKFEDPLPESHVGKMVVLLPRLRNDYFHGSHLLAPELLHLALEVREAADALTMPRAPDWKNSAGT